jgi:hypothetical protein
VEEVLDVEVAAVAIVFDNEHKRVPHDRLIKVVEAGQRGLLVNADPSFVVHARGVLSL